MCQPQYMPPISCVNHSICLLFHVSTTVYASYFMCQPQYMPPISYKRTSEPFTGIIYPNFPLNSKGNGFGRFTIHLSDPKKLCVLKITRQK